MFYFDSNFYIVFVKYLITRNKFVFNISPQPRKFVRTVRNMSECDRVTSLLDNAFASSFNDNCTKTRLQARLSLQWDVVAVLSVSRQCITIWYREQVYLEITSKARETTRRGSTTMPVNRRFLNFVRIERIFKDEFCFTYIMYIDIEPHTRPILHWRSCVPRRAFLRPTEMTLIHTYTQNYSVSLSMKSKYHN